MSRQCLESLPFWGWRMKGKGYMYVQGDEPPLLSVVRQGLQARSARPRAGKNVSCHSLTRAHPRHMHGLAWEVGKTASLGLNSSARWLAVL